MAAMLQPPYYRYSLSMQTFCYSPEETRKFIDAAALLSSREICLFSDDDLLPLDENEVVFALKLGVAVWVAVVSVLWSMG